MPVQTELPELHGAQNRRKAIMRHLADDLRKGAIARLTIEASSVLNTAFFAESAQRG